MAGEVTEAKSVVVKAEIKLRKQSGDDLLNSKELSQFALFSNLKKPINVDRFPGSMVFRSYRKGDVICRQGETGYSAFYVPSAADMRRWQALKTGLEASTSATEPGTEIPKPKLMAYILAGTTSARRRGFIRSLFTPRRKKGKEEIVAIPNDGPTDIDPETRTAAILEGDVFGEMSCMTFAPRSATVVAQEECHLIEFNRNIFDQLQKDENYREWMDNIYVERVLNTHLKGLEIFSGLNDQQLGRLRQAVKLEVVDPGTVICEEGESPNGKPLDVFVVRSGVVQVVRNAGFSLKQEDINWKLLCEQMIESQNSVSALPGSPPQSAVKSPRPNAGNTATADILATARKKKEESTSTPESPPKSKPSTADILAAARKKKEEGTADSTAEQPAKPSTADILAAMRKKNDGTSTETSPKPSTAEILAAARQKAAGEKESEQASHESPSLLKSSPPLHVGNAQHLVYSWFSPVVQQAVDRLHHSDQNNTDQNVEAHQKFIFAALQNLISHRDFLQTSQVKDFFHLPEVSAEIAAFPNGLKGIKKDWSELEVLIAGRSLLSLIFPAAIKATTETAGSHKVLAYLSRGDCFGEISIVRNEPRVASCIAYDHPIDGTGRKPGRVELVRIAGEVLKSLMDESPTLKDRVTKLAADRVKTGVKAGPERNQTLTSSLEFQKMGLFQGTELLLIDLDACTRCGECVSACIETHDDGLTRLYLDGPRFDRFLVPSACRSCLNPSCMIGCPVGSITRGDHGQIEIHDWCIGCQLCAQQCPYDSIQMHDLGLIADQTIGWSFCRKSELSSSARWNQRKQIGGNWATGMSPFYWTTDFRRAAGIPESQASEGLCFRYLFDNDRVRKQTNKFRLFLQSPAAQARVWLNGEELPLSQSPVQIKRGEREAIIDSRSIRKTSNLLAVELIPDAPFPELNQCMSLRVDMLPEAGERTSNVLEGNSKAEVELVTQRATVCDLCSDLPSQEPACVTSCPHEAAMRINPLFNFPV